MWNWFQTARRLGARRKVARFRPRVERLEARELMAGNVLATVKGGSLIVTGKDDGAQIEISQPVAWQFILKGDNGTTINGSDQPQTFQWATRDVVINLGKGDDFVSFDLTNSIIIGGNLIINGGKGINSVFANSFDTGGSLDVAGTLNINNLSAGGALTTLVNVNVGGDLRIQGRGPSSVTIGTSQSAEATPAVNTIGGSLMITNGAGDQNFTEFKSLNVRRNVTVENHGARVTTIIDSEGDQNSVGGQLQVINGPGDFETTVVDQTKVGKNLEIRASGQGQDNVILHALDIKGNTNIVGTSGVDSIDINEATFGGAFQLQTGQGADHVQIGTSAVEQIVVTLLVPEERTEIIERNGMQFTITVVVLRPVSEVRTISTLGTLVTFKGNVTASFGDGDDTLALAADATVSFNKQATFDGQAGTNTATINAANLPASNRGLGRTHFGCILVVRPRNRHFFKVIASAF